MVSFVNTLEILLGAKRSSCGKIAPSEMVFLRKNRSERNGLLAEKLLRAKWSSCGKIAPSEMVSSRKNCSERNGLLAEKSLRAKWSPQKFDIFLAMYIISIV